MKAFSVRSLLITATAVGALAAPATSLGATIDVNSNADVMADDGHCTLREAVIAANTNTASGAMPSECRAGAGPDTIALPAGRYTRTLGGSSEDAGATGDLDVLDDVTIHGAGSASTVIDAAHLDRVLDVASGVALGIEGVTITGGTATAGPLGSPGGSGGPGDDGGGIRNKGTLTLMGCVVTDNHAGAGGAGGSATGTAGVSNPPSAQAGGSALGGRGGVGGRGGGIFSTGLVTLTSSRITLNGAGQGGAAGDGTGGAANSQGSTDGAAGGDGSALSAGDGGGGGGLFSAGSGKVTVTDSAISDNAAGRGGKGGAGTGGHGGPNNGTTFGPGGPGGPGFGGAGGSGGEGGGLSVTGPLALSSTTINGNSSGRGGDGGAGHGGDGGSPVTGPANGGAGGTGNGGIAGSGGRGGGVLQLASLTAVNVTVTGNRTGGGASAGSGTGGGGAGGTVEVHGGAGGAGNGAAGGSGGDGAGIWAETLTLQHGTVTANTAGAGSSGGTGTGGGGGTGGNGGTQGAAGGKSDGGARDAGSGAGILTHSGATVTSSILAANEPANCAGTFTDGGFNLDFPDSACPGDAADPAVAALADNGGPTPTQAITVFSPAHDRVPVGAACAATDQRGVTRPQGPACDAGAFEFAPLPPPPPGGDKVAPVFSLASLTSNVFAVDPKGAAEVSVAAAKKKPKRGTTFRFTLSEAGRVVFTIEQRTVGRKVAKKCRKLTRKNRKRPHCTLYLRAGRFAAKGAAGPNRHKFSGRIGRKSLKPGRYRARLVAADSAGNKSKPVLLSFEVVRAR